MGGESWGIEYSRIGLISPMNVIGRECKSHSGEVKDSELRGREL